MFPPSARSQSSIANAGVLTKTGTTGITTLGVTFVNTGAVAVQSSTITLTGNGTLSGPITNSSGAAFIFSSGSYTLTNGFSATGSGGLILSGGQVNFLSAPPGARCPT